jgi:hypothetical protein
MSLSPLEPSFKPSSGLTLCEDAAAFIQHLVVCSLYGMDPKHQVVVPKTISNTLLEDLYLAHRIFDEAASEKNECQSHSDSVLLCDSAHPF